MHPKLTDQAVSDLPLHAGRAELLEEIMSTPALDRVDAPTPDPRRPRPRWAVPAAAAVLVAAMAGVPAWLANSDGQDGADGPGGAGGPADGPVAAAPSPAAEQTFRAVLDAPGWEVTHVYEEPDEGGEMSYSRGGQELEIHWRPAVTHRMYVKDRSEGGRQPGTPVRLLGRPGLMWAYSADDHTVIREPEAGHLLEVRGSGMAEAAYLALLEELRLVDAEGFAAALPAAYVTDAERPEAIAEMLAGMARTTDPLFPPGADTEVASTQLDRYHLGADVTAAVACAWMDELEEGLAEDDGPRVEAAADALAGSRAWPVLQEMAADGDWPAAIWDLADRAAAGQVAEGWREGLCDRG